MKREKTTRIRQVRGQRREVKETLNTLYFLGKLLLLGYALHGNR